MRPRPESIQIEPPGPTSEEPPTMRTDPPSSVIGFLPRALPPFRWTEPPFPPSYRWSSVPWPPMILTFPPIDPWPIIPPPDIFTPAPASYALWPSPAVKLTFPPLPLYPVPVLRSNCPADALTEAPVLMITSPETPSSSALLDAINKSPLDVCSDFPVTIAIDPPDEYFEVPPYTPMFPPESRALLKP